MPLHLLFRASPASCCSAASPPAVSAAPGPQKAGSVLWLTADSGELGAAAQNRLPRSVGLKEIFLDAAEISGGAIPICSRSPRRRSSRHDALVVSGRWSPGDRPPDGLATALVSGSHRCAWPPNSAAWRSSDAKVRVGPASTPSLGKTLGRLRTLLGSSYFVSRRIRAQGARRARPGRSPPASTSSSASTASDRESEDPAAWDLRRVEELPPAQERSSALLHQYRHSGYGGAARQRQADARNLDNSRSAATHQARNLELKPGFSLQGIDRRSGSSRRGPARAGPWTLAPGESIRVSADGHAIPRGVPASPRRLGSPRAGWAMPHRLRRDDERLSLSGGQPRRRARSGRCGAGPSTWLSGRSRPPAAAGSCRVRLANHRSSESTDLAFFDSNYVQIQVAGATVRQCREAGEFQRVELLVDGEKGTMRAFREANMARLCTFPCSKSTRKSRAAASSSD